MLDVPDNDVVHWQEAENDSLWKALLKLRDYSRMRAIKHAENLEDRINNSPAVAYELYREAPFRDLAFQATAADALRRLYEMAGQKAADEGKPLEDQRAAAREALRHVTAKLRYAIEKPGQRPLQFDGDEQGAFDAALNDNENYLIGTRVDIDKMDQMIDRRRFLKRTTGAAIGLGATALAAGGYAATQSFDPPRVTDTHRKEMGASLQERLRLARDPEAWKPEHIGKTMEFYNKAMERDGELLQPRYLTRNTVDNLTAMGIAGATGLGTLACLLMALEERKQCQFDDTDMPSVISGLQSLTEALGKVLQHKYIQPHLQQEKGAARG